MVRSAELGGYGRRGTAAESELLASKRHRRRGKVRITLPEISVNVFILRFEGHLDPWRFAGIDKGRGRKLNRLKKSRDGCDNRCST